MVAAGAVLLPVGLAFLAMAGEEWNRRDWADREAAREVSCVMGVVSLPRVLCELISCAKGCVFRTESSPPWSFVFAKPFPKSSAIILADCGGRGV